MINFNQYINKPVVLITNDFDSYEDISGIRICNSTVFRFQGKWVLTRLLTSEDLKDEDYCAHLDSIWHHNEEKLKTFLKHKKEYINAASEHTVSKESP